MATRQITSSFRQILRSESTSSRSFARMMGSDQGRSEGAIREAGGAFGKKEKAQEDQFFRQQQLDQLKKLKENDKSKDAKSGQK